MKLSTKSWLKSVVSLALVLSMVLCTPLTAFAATVSTGAKDYGSGLYATEGVKDVNGDGVITIAAYGDSVTNGYGMDGYRYPDGSNVLGFLREPEDSWPVRVMRHLEETQDLPVELEQLAISGFRADEVHWMLCNEPGCFVADSFGNDRFVADGWCFRCIRDWVNGTGEDEVKDYLAYLGEDYSNYSFARFTDRDKSKEDVLEANKIISDVYQSAAEKADVILLDIGNNNFGTFVTSTVQAILGKETPDFDTDFELYLDEKSAASLEYIIASMCQSLFGNDPASYQICLTLSRCLIYGYLGFTENFDETIKDIKKLNPDAKIIVVDLYTMLSGVDLEGSIGGDVDMDNMYNLFINAANFYTRELSPYSHLVTHVTLEEDPELFIDNFATYSYPDNQTMSINVTGDDADEIKALHSNGSYNEVTTTLFQEFVIEKTPGWGYDAVSEPAVRQQFANEMLAPITQLDNYVYRISQTIDEMAINGGVNINGLIKENIGANVPTVEKAIENVAFLYSAVDGVNAAENAVKESVIGLETAKDAAILAILGVEAATGAVNQSAEGINTAKTAIEKSKDGVSKANTAIGSAKDGINTAKDVIVSANEGVAATATAITAAQSGLNTAKDAVNTAYSGVAQVQGIVDMLKEELISNSAFKGRETTGIPKSIILSTIGKNITDDLMVQAGLAPTAENREMLVNEVYEMGCIYYENKSNASVANEKSVKYGMTRILEETQGLSNADATAKADLAYTIYNLKNSQGEEAAVKYAISTEADSIVAQFAANGVTVNKADVPNLVWTLGNSSVNDESAIKTVLGLKADDIIAEFSANGITVTKDEAVNLIYDLGRSNANDEAAIKKVLKLKETEINSTFAANGITVPQGENVADIVYYLGTADNASAVKKAISLAIPSLPAELINQLGAYETNEAKAEFIYKLATLGEEEAIKLALGTQINTIKENLSKNDIAYADDADAINIIYKLGATDNTNGSATKYAIELGLKENVTSLFPTEMTKAQIAEKVYAIGTSGHEKVGEDIVPGATAIKLAIEIKAGDIVKGFEEKGVKVDMTDAQVAELVYDLGTIGCDENGAPKPEAVKLAIEAIVDKEMADKLGGGDKTVAAATIYEIGTGIRDAQKADAENGTETEKTFVVNLLVKFGGKDENGNDIVSGDKAALAYGIYKIYKAEADEEKGFDAAMIYAIDQAGKAELNKTETEEYKPSEVLQLIGATEGLAEAVYYVYKDIAKEATDTNEYATYEQEELVYVTFIGTQYPDIAEALFYCYAGKVDEEGEVYSIDGHFNDEDILKVLKTFMEPMVTEAVLTDIRTNPENDLYPYLNGKTDEEIFGDSYFGPIVENAIADQIESAINSYLTYKNLPITLMKIANVDTIYFDALLSSVGDTSAVASKFMIPQHMEGHLSLDAPNYPDNNDEAWRTYKSDSALATMDFRFLTGNGVYTHPSEKGAAAIANAIIDVLDELVVAPEDEPIVIDANSRITVLGDSIAAKNERGTNSTYVDYIQEYTGIPATNLSESGYRLDEVLAILDSNFEGDAYTAEMLGNDYSAKTSLYTKSIENSDIVVVNLGAMNMGFIAMELQKFTSSGETYPIRFANVDSMDIRGFGKGVDDLLGGFQSGFRGDSETVPVNPTTTMMLGFESYGYGFTTYNTYLNNLVENIHSINENAHIVLVGQYDLIENTVFDNGEGGFFAFGDFVYHASSLMNEFTKNYAEMTRNCTYVDVSDTANDNVNTNANLGGDDMPDVLASIFVNAHPTDAGHQNIAKKVACAINGHATSSNKVTWTWPEESALIEYAEERNHNADDVIEVGVSFTCDNCNESINESVKISEGNGLEVIENCVEQGDAKYTAFYTPLIKDSKSVKIDAIGHNLGNPEWTWDESDFSKDVTVKFTCQNKSHRVTCDYSETYTTTPVKTTDTPTCENEGLDTFTATISIDAKEHFHFVDENGDRIEIVNGKYVFSDVKTSVLGATGHTYGNPVWNWSEDFKTASVTVTCSVCDENEANHVITVDANVEESIIPEECVEDGLATYNASVTIDEVEYTDFKEKVLPMTNVHVYVDGYCNMCGKQDPKTHGSCEYYVGANLGNGGTYILDLGGSKVGTYTFTPVSDGWAIKDSNGQYLSVDSNGALVRSGSAYAWTYSNGQFSTSVGNGPSNWLQAILGTGNKKTTYYLVASGSGVTTSTSAANAAFYTIGTSEYHSFDAVVHDSTCTEGGYTALTCTRCGYYATDGEKPELGHNYSEKTVAPTCDNKGYVEHTCSRCGNVYKDNEVSPLGHDIVDGTCQNCGQPDYVIYGECTYRTEASLSNGTYVTTLGGKEVGKYTYTSVDGGWTIKDSNGKYLSVDNSGALVRSDSAFTWNYSNGQFSASVGNGASNWLQALLGTGSKKTTYYLAASGNDVSASTVGVQAGFFAENEAEYHDFTSNEFAPSCGKEGYTEYTCSRCGYSYQNNYTDALEHDYIHEEKDATCTEKGGDYYTCSVCGDVKIENEVPALGHDFVDGTCIVCGTPDEPDCVEKVESAVVNGTFEMIIGGTNVGEYTFTSVSGGWTIKDANGKYLGVNANGSLVQLDGEFTWTYSGGKFSASVGKGPANWLQALLGTGNKKTTYYLVASGSGVGVSTSDSSASAKVLIETDGNHVYGSAKPSDGNHLYTCLYCGYVKSEECGDDNCAICNATVTVSVSVVNGKGPANWLQALLGTGSKDSSATITTAASGTTVTSVAYSLDNGNTWTNGSSFTSKNPITSFQIRVIADNGFTYMYSYNNGTVTAIG